MGFSEIFIRRLVLSTVVAILILLLGGQGILNMSIRQYPKVDETVITVTTTYTGASSDLIQGFITTPISKAVSSAEGVDYITSSSTLGTSTVQVHMRLNTNPDKALTEVIAKVQQVRNQLPTDAFDPVIQKGTGQTFAIMYLAVLSENMTPPQISEYMTRVIQPRLSTVDGVADAQLLGAQTFSMRVWLDPVLMGAHNVTASDVVAAINSSNFLSAPGKTQNDLVAYRIELQTTLPDPAAFGALPLRTNGDNVVRLRDVAKIELGPASTDVKIRFNGVPGTFMGIYPTPAANPLTVSKLVKAELDPINAGMPAGTKIVLVYDSTKFITASIEEVFKTIGEAVIIVILVIFLFLGSVRTVLIPVVTIPISLIGVCFFLYMFGFSLNTLTLLAMVLAIGLVVDDAIVVVENIHRHIEDGMRPFDAAITGMKEITSAVIAMTITLAAVYAPIGFAQGLTGSLFREFAVTLAGAVVISGFAAITLSPMMSARLLKPHGGGRLQHFIDRTFDGLARWYGRRLTSTLKYRPVTLMIAVAVLGTAVFLVLNTSSELAPEEDQGALFSIANAPRYATSDYVKLYTDQADQLTKDLPELDARFQLAGAPTANQAFTIWSLKPWGERSRTQKQIQPELQAKMNQIAGLEAFLFSPPSLPGAGGGLPISFVVQSTSSSDKVYEVAEEIRQKALATGKFIVVQNSMSFDTPNVRFTIDRNRAAALGVSVSDIGTTLGVMVGGASISKFDRDSRSYDIIPQVPREYRANPENLSAFYVRSASGAMVPLSSVVTIQTGAAPAALEQFSQLNSATISALPLPGVTTGDGLAEIRSIAGEVMPDGFFENFAGQSRLEIEQGNTILLAFGLAVIVIYLVLAAQFESFRNPLIIMMSVPLSIFGALIPLNIGLGTLNIYTQVGLITLIGLITKHGILMVQFAEQLRATGMPRLEAIIHAAGVRLRPILMTTAAMVLGVVPLITASGAGASARYSIGLVIATGMAVGTLFTLFVVPMFYTYIAESDAAKKKDLEHEAAIDAEIHHADGAPKPAH
jgi:multidrug efflux pump